MVGVPERCWKDDRKWEGKMGNDEFHIKCMQFENAGTPRSSCSGCSLISGSGRNSQGYREGGSSREWRKIPKGENPE